jgi:ferredoxin
MWVAGETSSAAKTAPPNDAGSDDRGTPVTYVITEACRGVKDAGCVEVCPVDCIHPMPDEDGFDAAEQLYIDPVECIDCDACVATCPVDAIFAGELVPEALRGSIAANAQYFTEQVR